MFLIMNFCIMVQAFEAMYRWHERYPLGSNPLAKLSAPVVLQKLRQFAVDFHIYEATFFSSEIISTTFEEHEDRQALFYTLQLLDQPALQLKWPCCSYRYIAQYRDLVNGEVKSITAQFVMVTTGILGTQHTLQDRGYADVDKFKGVTTLAGRECGIDSLIGRLDCGGKVGPVLVCLS